MPGWLKMCFFKCLFQNAIRNVPFKSTMTIWQAINLRNGFIYSWWWWWQRWWKVCTNAEWDRVGMGSPAWGVCGGGEGFLFLPPLAPSPIGCRVGYVTSIALIACFSYVHGVGLWCVLHALRLHWLYTHWHGGQSSLTCPGRLASDLCFKALLISAKQWSVWPKHLPICLVVIKIWMLQFKIRVYRSQLFSQFPVP